MGKVVWRLIIGEPGSASRRFEMARSEILVGRAAGCDLRLADPAVSGQHARIFVREGQLRVQDLGSTNGSYVAGPGPAGACELRSAMAADLQPGMTLTLGSTRIEVLGAADERVSQAQRSPGADTSHLTHPGETGVAGTGGEAAPEPAAGSSALLAGPQAASPVGDQRPASPPPAARSATTARIHRVTSESALHATSTDAGATQVRRRLARLTLSGQGLQRVVDIQSTPFVIGRRAGPGVDLVLRHEQVSSRHLMIEFAEGRFQVRDLASSNGTRVNSSRLLHEQAQPLPPDSSLDVGPIHCLFSCLYDDEGRTIDPADYVQAAQSLVAEGLVGPDQLTAAEEALQRAPATRHLGEMLLSEVGTRLTVQRWLNALRRVREASRESPSGWRAIVNAASGLLGRS